MASIIANLTTSQIAVLSTASIAALTESQDAAPEQGPALADVVALPRRDREDPARQRKDR